MKKFFKKFNENLESAGNKIHHHDECDASTDDVDELFEQLYETIKENRKIGLVMLILSCHSNPAKR